MSAATALTARPHGATLSIPEQLAAPGTCFSFEFFPPKTDRGWQTLWSAIERLEPLRPAFVSVTYGAGGTTRDRTVAITQRIAAETSLLPVGHLTCVGATRDQVRAVIEEYGQAGVHSIMALRGDPEGGPLAPWTPTEGGLTYASELVELIRATGDFTVGVAAFPDKHVASPSLERDAEVLVAKARAGASFAVTQMVFDVEAYLRLRDRVAAAGADLPIVPGLMPVTRPGQVERMAELSGTALPAEVTSRLARFGDDVEAVRAEGIAIASEHASRLIAEGAPGLHFCTMNTSTATTEILHNLGAAQP